VAFRGFGRVYVRVVSRSVSGSLSIHLSICRPPRTFDVSRRARPLRALCRVLLLSLGIALQAGISRTYCVVTAAVN